MAQGEQPRVTELLFRYEEDCWAGSSAAGGCENSAMWSPWYDRGEKPSSVGDLLVSRTPRDPAVQSMYDELEAAFREFKRAQRWFPVLRRVREARDTMRMEALERSVRGDLEKIVRKMLRADWTHLSSREVIEKMDYLKNAASAFRVLKTRLRKQSVAVFRGVSSRQLDNTFWKLTAREMGVPLGFRQPFFAVRAYVRTVLTNVNSEITGDFENCIKHFRIRKFITYCEDVGLFCGKYAFRQ